MHKFYILLSILFFSLPVTSQEEEPLYCGSEISDVNIEYLTKLNNTWAKQTQIKATTTSTKFVPVQFHIIRRDDGTGGISKEEVLRALENLNDLYIGAGMQFYDCLGINYINDTSYYDYDKDQMEQLHAEHSVENMLNVYIANKVYSGGDSICGHAQFPGGLDFVMLNTSCMQNGTSLSHEIGHYFGLYHTHETKFGDEAVNGSDCIFSGDLMCDTAADPRLSSSSNVDKDGCKYYGSDIDENGQTYSPPIANIMSYSAKECKYEFSPKQYDKLRYTFDNQRDYLTCGEEQELKAFFYAQFDPTCESNKQVDFYNASLGEAANIQWDFGDGSAPSSQESPNHTYTKDGIFTVTLTITKGGTSSFYNQKIVVGAVLPPYGNGFELNQNNLDNFELSESLKNNIDVVTDFANSGSKSLMLSGSELTSTSPKFQSPSSNNAFKDSWNLHYKSKLFLCVDARNFDELKLQFYKKQIRNSEDDYTNLRIAVNGNTINTTIRVENPGTDDDEFEKIEMDLSAYDGQVFTLSIEGSHKYHKDRSGMNSGTATFIDDFKLMAAGATLSVDDLLSEEAFVYPNPVINHLNLRCSTDDLATLRVYTVHGQEVTPLIQVIQNNGSIAVLDLSSLEKGMYLINIKGTTQKIFKQ